MRKGRREERAQERDSQKINDTKGREMDNLTSFVLTTARNINI